MSDSPCILAVDLGTSGCKAALVTIRGEVLRWAFAPVQLHLVDGGGAEQDPEDWWRAIITTTHELLSWGVVSPDRIAAVCCSTQGEGTVPVDADGRPLMNAILWMDMRGAPHVRRMAHGPIRISGYDIVKLWRWIKYTGGAPSLTGKDPAGHMLFIREALPEIYEKTHKFLNVLDFINYRLAGRFVATFDSILTSWVTDNRNPSEIRYHDGLLARCGIAREKLPEIVPCTAPIGPLIAGAARALGLREGIPIIAGAIDSTAAAVGSGGVRDGDAHLYIGTSSWLTAHVPFKHTDIFTGMASIPCAIPNRYVMMALQATAGGNLTWLRDNVLYPRDPFDHAPPEAFFDRLNEAAAQSPPGSRGVFYTPWIYGERSPVEDPSVRAGWHNLSLQHTRADMLRAMLEGIALNKRWLLGPFEKNMRQRLDAIRFVGGGANSALWCQILADVLDRPIRQMAEPIQVNVRGAALIAALGLGHCGVDDIPARVPVLREYTPRPEFRGLYDNAFGIFQELYKRNRGIYARLNR